MMWQTYLTTKFQLNWWQKKETLLTSQSPNETTSELPLIYQYQDWMLEE
jgi:hypothetical protein